ncbi:MAG: carbon-nitrogen hydrolase family protein [Thermoplasmata archaeon]
MKLTLPSVKHKFLSPETNLKLIEENAKDTDIAVFPEMFITGYSLKNRMLRYAEPLHGKIGERLSRIAEEYGTTIVAGMPEFDLEKRMVFNSAVIAMPDGRLESYRKQKLATFGPFEEALFFAPGEEKYPVFEVSGIRAGILICYELFFPEIAKEYALKSADLLICISASPSTTKKFFESVLKARSIENTVFVAYSNLLGTEQNLVFWGGQRLYDPRGELVANIEPYTHGKLIAEIEEEKLKIARKLRPTIADTHNLE